VRQGARLALLAGFGLTVLAPAADSADRPPVSLIKMPYRGERNVAELSASPDYLEKGGPTPVLALTPRVARGASA
jgi:hypothetical protein